MNCYWPMYKVDSFADLCRENKDIFLLHFCEFLKNEDVDIKNAIINKERISYVNDVNHKGMSSRDFVLCLVTYYNQRYELAAYICFDIIINKFKSTDSSYGHEAVINYTANLAAFYKD